MTAFSKVLRAFVQANGDASQSPNLRMQCADDVRALCAVFSEPKLAAYDDLYMLLIWVIKILSRKVRAPVLSDEPT